MSDIFFIVSSVCVVIVTLLLSLLLIKLITLADDAVVVSNNAKNVSYTVSETVSKVSSFLTLSSPLAGIASMIFRRKGSKKRG